MSRSTREPYHPVCQGADPATGKRVTSRRLRRAAKRAAREPGDDFEAARVAALSKRVGPQDRNRGRAGSRSPDWGWTFMGDGRARASTEPWATKMRRK